MKTEIDFENYFKRLDIEDISKWLDRPFTDSDKKRMKTSFIENNGALNLIEIYPDKFHDFYPPLNNSSIKCSDFGSLDNSIGSLSTNVNELSIASLSVCK